MSTEDSSLKYFVGDRRVGEIVVMKPDIKTLKNVGSTVNGQCIPLRFTASGWQCSFSGIDSNSPPSWLETVISKVTPLQALNNESSDKLSIEATCAFVPLFRARLSDFQGANEYYNSLADDKKKPSVSLVFHSRDKTTSSLQTCIGLGKHLLDSWVRESPLDECGGFGLQLLLKSAPFQVDGTYYSKEWLAGVRRPSLQIDDGKTLQTFEWGHTRPMPLSFRLLTMIGPQNPEENAEYERLMASSVRTGLPLVFSPAPRAGLDSGPGL